ncbi:MAG: CocE/NonD family hydrolase [bacterium]|nr:CocE/NonD family hydrolase [bacterium]
MCFVRRGSVLLCIVLASMGLAIQANAATITLTGTVTETGTGDPVIGATVSATRADYLGTTQSDQPITVEVSVATNASGQYTISIDDGTPDLDRVLVYTRSLTHFNELYDDVATSGATPTYGDTQQAGVVEVNFTSSVTGIDFVLEDAGSGMTTYMVEMSDGVRLATDVYVPPGTGPWPTMLYRTPYGKDTDAVGTWPSWVARGYVVVSQDIRGNYGSEDIFRAYYDDGWGANRDGYETVEWIRAQSWSDGDICTLGGSARGISQNFLMGSIPPGLVCQHINVAASNMYTQAMFQGGAFRKALTENWMDGQGPAARAYLESDIKTRPHSDDPYWDYMRPETRYGAVTWPTVNQGGWYDIFLRGTINNFLYLQHNGQPGSDGNHKLIIGPYGHGAPQSSFAWPDGCTNSGAAYQSSAAWSDYWVKGIDTGVMDDPPVAYYMLGDVTQPAGPGNEWHFANDWPVPATEVPFYLHAGGVLNNVPPDGIEAADVYDYDPTDPVPTLGGANLTISRGPYDQASLEARDDVIVFTTPVLTEHVEITGQVTVVLYASSSALDTDFTAKLCDVYPDGRSMLVCDGIIRARHRNTQATDELLTPGQAYEFTIDLWETCIAFNVGHRIRLAISSSNYPRFHANPNTGEPFNQETTTVVATNSLFHQIGQESHLLLRVTGPDADVNGIPDPADLDGDAMVDTFEWRIIRDNPSDGIVTLEDVLGTDDYDGDGHTNATEHMSGTDPLIADGALPAAGVLATVMLALLMIGVVAVARKRARA